MNKILTVLTHSAVIVGLLGIYSPFFNLLNNISKDAELFYDLSEMSVKKSKEEREIMTSLYRICKKERYLKGIYMRERKKSIR